MYLRLIYERYNAVPSHMDIQTLILKSPLWRRQLHGNDYHVNPQLIHLMLTTDSNITWFSHIVTTIKPPQKISCITDYEHSWRHTVNSHNMTLTGNS
ncbi:hypothetical protein ALC60_01473 [Trachymyrmex zeteki]|uniref:Uncharacterized protein n=1 Tax=Mycetomoellerius zeteki TaxID=64791 RepID=A0A151XGR2_9HYME|nr:hypothetical protein ALC60_01473 [Trachymyrmex zeteki]